MKNRVFKVAIIGLSIFCLMQVSIYALNNNGFGESPYMTWLTSGVMRWANDVDDPVRSGAETDAWTVYDWEDENLDNFVKSFNWDAWAWVYYPGTNKEYESEYHIRVEALGFPRWVSNTTIGKLDEMREITITISPPAQGQSNDIDDCKASGLVIGTDPTTNEKSRTHSKIPFP